MLSIRRYRDTDREAVRALHEIALRRIGAYAESSEVRAWDQDLDDVDGVYLSTGGEFLVGELDGAIVAMGALRPLGEGRGEIKRMRVHPDQQGRGFGRAMLLQLEDAAHRRGLTTLVLDTSQKQQAALALYERHGYREVAREQRGELELSFMEKSLPTPDRPN